MDRTLAGRVAPSRLPWPLSGVLRAPGRIPAGDAARSLGALLTDRRRMRIAFVSMLAALPLLGGGWLWFRNSSFVAVHEVRVTGLKGPEAQEIESALIGAAHHMSTLDVHPASLIAAVAGFRVVRAVEASAHFPHSLSIHVVEQLPVAAVELGGVRTAVAADGAVLGPALLRGSLPTMSAGGEGAGSDLLPGQYVRGGTLLSELTVLGAEPAPFRKLVSRIYSGPMGVTVALRNGPLAYFGDDTLPHAKWLSLARVLLDSSSAGASYIDVRVPERPAAGFPAGGGPQSSTGTLTEELAAGATTTSATEPTTAAELAAGLAAALGGGTATGSTDSTAGREAAPGGQATEATSTTLRTESTSAQEPETTAPSTSETTAPTTSETPATAP